jgi:hypothetical protein
MTLTQFQIHPWVLIVSNPLAASWTLALVFGNSTANSSHALIASMHLQTTRYNDGADIQASKEFDVII